ncbi:zinc protease [Thermotomaculum hydrothermale]|uniref:Zinc protease n=1 Tax=Thermotomaculum hydrothermale TaxID=981385 RepID=A0A7R6PKL8_9BACT|nr:pitrilysin family protein [Thermotomaculum hydrothermale]BBB31882.1 zinc protease [Thermotomaculum hydrothermale]
MRKISLIIIFALFSIYSFSIVKNYKEIKYPPLKVPEKVTPEKIELNNGLTVLILEDHELPVVSGEIMFHAGSVCDPDGKEGLSELFSNVLRTGGNSLMNGDEMDEFLEGTASSIEASSDDTSISVSFDCLKENFPKVFDLFVATLTSPEFEQQKIEIAKAQMKAMIVRRNDDPKAIARRVFSRRIYGLTSPFSKQAELATVSAITREDLIAYREKYFCGKNAVMYIYGDFNAKEVKKLLKDKLAKSLKTGEKAQLPSKIKPEKSGIYFVQREGVTQSNIVFGNLVKMKKDNPDYPAAVIFSRILGGGFSSRFMKTIRRDMGLSYSPHAYIYAPYNYYGFFMGAINTRLNATGKVIETALSIIKDIQENGVTEEELKQVKDEFLNSYVFQFDSKEKQIAKVAYYTFYGYPVDFNERFFNAVKKVTNEDIKRVANKYIDLNNLTIAVVGDSSKFDMPLTKFGKVYPVDVTIPGLKEMQMKRMQMMKMMKEKMKKKGEKVKKHKVLKKKKMEKIKQKTSSK